MVFIVCCRLCAFGGLKKTTDIDFSNQESMKLNPKIPRKESTATSVITSCFLGNETTLLTKKQQQQQHQRFSELDGWVYATFVPPRTWWLRHRATCAAHVRARRARRTARSGPRGLRRLCLCVWQGRVRGQPANQQVSSAEMKSRGRERNRGYGNWQSGMCWIFF